MNKKDINSNVNNHNRTKNSSTSIPSWLETRPSSKISPPVKPKKQELPFGELSWEDFEKLCLRLVRLEADVEHCQLYGVHGQKQEGIDIYARKKFEEKYRVYQCKRVKNFEPSKIKKAVSKFLKGEWAKKADTFVLCTQESLNKTERANELENQSNLLKKYGIQLLSWDKDQLSIKLKDHPKLVDDFFGREWVKAFCGEGQAKKLGKPRVPMAVHYNVFLECKNKEISVTRTFNNTSHSDIITEKIATIKEKCQHFNWNQPNLSKEIGTILFTIVNGDNQLLPALKEADLHGEPLHLYIHRESTVPDLPFELLYHSQFLVPSKIHVIRYITGAVLISSWYLKH